MKGWTLDYVQSLEQDTYDELVAWVTEIESAQQDSTDMDRYVAERKDQAE